MPPPTTDQPRVSPDEVMFAAFEEQLAQRCVNQPGTAIARILYAVDFSPCSLYALAQAQEFARRFGAELVLLYVDSALTIYEHELPRIGERALERSVEVLRARDTRARAIWKRGVPSDVILRTAALEQADLIVMGTHGRTGLRHALMGSVTEAVLRAARCPVLVVCRPESTA